MPSYLVEVRACFLATQTDPDANDLVVEGWELDGYLEYRPKDDTFEYRAERDMRVEADNVGEARRLATERAPAIVAPSGWAISEIDLDTDLIIPLDGDPEVTLPTP